MIMWGKHKRRKLKVKISKKKKKQKQHNLIGHMLTILQVGILWVVGFIKQKIIGIFPLDQDIEGYVCFIEKLNVVEIVFHVKSFFHANEMFCA